jgi:hypothetical protein
LQTIGPPALIATDGQRNHLLGVFSLLSVTVVLLSSRQKKREEDNQKISNAGKTKNQICESALAIVFGQWKNIHGNHRRVPQNRLLPAASGKASDRDPSGRTGCTVTRGLSRAART